MFDFCMNPLNGIVLGLYCSCVMHFIVRIALMFLYCFNVLLCFTVLYCIDLRLWHLNIDYLLITYLLIYIMHLCTNVNVIK